MILFIIFLVIYCIGCFIKGYNEAEYKMNKRKAAKYAAQKYDNEKKSLQDAELERLQKEAEILRLKKEIEELKNNQTITE